jgi:hypothetical protein
MASAPLPRKIEHGAAARTRECAFFRVVSQLFLMGRWRRWGSRRSLSAECYMCSFCALPEARTWDWNALSTLAIAFRGGGAYRRRSAHVPHRYTSCGYGGGRGGALHTGAQKAVPPPECVDGRYCPTRVIDRSRASRRVDARWGDENNAPSMPFDDGPSRGDRCTARFLD